MGLNLLETRSGLYQTLEARNGRLRSRRKLRIQKQHKPSRGPL
jgi:hypothetical protein